jgi:hypothetical protein
MRAACWRGCGGESEFVVVLVVAVAVAVVVVEVVVVVVIIIIYHRDCCIPHHDNVYFFQPRVHEQRAA